MEIYVKFLVFPYLIYFLVFKHDLIRCFKQQVMTSQIRSRIEYLIQTYHILVLML